MCLNQSSLRLCCGGCQKVGGVTGAGDRGACRACGSSQGPAEGVGIRWPGGDGDELECRGTSCRELSLNLEEFCSCEETRAQSEEKFDFLRFQLKFSSDQNQTLEQPHERKCSGCSSASSPTTLCICLISTQQLSDLLISQILVYTNTLTSL
ncbi:unnamed protein product [Pleuronectes platessa]|uniref:Uncharacterized protein n=1 Tax=Pleuronectes platessa TaxID=8262 RepID=A0A9N7UNM9_PLEPL|nr:unnamed protein product [Pleuronectes platessa]